jgi:hypothetical protein
MQKRNICNRWCWCTDSEYMQKPKYKNPRIIFLVFDHLVGDANAFRTSHSAINKLIIIYALNIAITNVICYLQHKILKLYRQY